MCWQDLCKEHRGKKASHLRRNMIICCISQRRTEGFHSGPYEHNFLSVGSETRVYCGGGKDLAVRPVFVSLWKLGWRDENGSCMVENFVLPCLINSQQTLSCVHLRSSRCSTPPSPTRKRQDRHDCTTIKAAVNISG